jgi:hypothetical protein
MVLENYFRSEAALIARMTEMVINGVSTRKAYQEVETLCGTILFQIYGFARVKRSSQKGFL